MYHRPPSQDLLQGDVIDYFTYSTVRLPRAEDLATIVLKKHRVVLVSHSCDLDESRNKRQAFLFTPLISVVNYIKKDNERYEAFKRNTIEPEKPVFLNLFRYEAAPEIGGEEQMIDFSTIQAAHIAFLSLCRPLKLMELTTQVRELLQNKLIYHFGRRT